MFNKRNVIFIANNRNSGYSKNREMLKTGMKLSIFCIKSDIYTKLITSYIKNHTIKQCNKSKYSL